MQSLVEVRDLKVRYGKFEAVKGVSFTLQPGEILGIVGESGSGKSTVAKALVGLERPSAGEIAVRSRRLQMVFQDAVGSLNPRMKVRTALEEALAHARRRALADGRSLPAGAKALLDMVGLPESVLELYPREMSGGQCQRISIARALAFSPEVLIADEPVSALDVSVQARVLNLLRDLNRELDLSIVLVAHDLAVVKNVCARVCVMHKGLFVESGDAEQVFSSPRNEYTRKLLAAIPAMA
jgi:ABC-type glutathione transport system ATPase component